MREIQIIDYIQKRAGKMPKEVKMGIGDDAAVLDIGGKDLLLWAQDMIVDGTHFRSGKDAYKKIGRKAVAVNISDIAAMGGIPKYISVSMGIPKGMKSSAVKALSDGISAICSQYGIKILGGDTVKSGKLVVDVSIIGKVKKNEFISRSGSECGDIILITGPIRNGKKTHLDFIPRMEESRYLAGKKATSMIDVSDGIAPDLIRICKQSGTGCRIFADNIFLNKGLSLKDALYYGESFELLFTMKEKDVKKLSKGFTGYNFYIIGEMTDKKKGYSLVDGKGRLKTLEFMGFEH